MNPQNTIFVIRPYKWFGMWVFDDPDRNLVREPFVAGADRMIDRATANIPNAAKGFLLVFSPHRFPDAQITLEWVREADEGNVYRWPEENMEGWLCPALQSFLSPAPPHLFIQVKPAR